MRRYLLGKAGRVCADGHSANYTDRTWSRDLKKSGSRMSEKSKKLS